MGPGWKLPMQRAAKSTSANQTFPPSVSASIVRRWSSGLAPSSAGDRSRKSFVFNRLCPLVSVGGPSWNCRDQVNMWISLPSVVLGHDGRPICADQLARGRLVRSSQVEQVVIGAAWLALAQQVVILGLADHLAAMGDSLNVILILMAWLIQGILVKREDGKNRHNTAFIITLTRNVYSLQHSW